MPRTPPTPPAAWYAGYPRGYPEKPLHDEAGWLQVLRLIPGYNAIATRGASVFHPGIAQRACQFFPECIQHVQGELAGHPFDLAPWQQAVVANIFGWIRPDGARRYREVFLFVPRKNGKRLALDTPIPTPSGWKNMGELQVGDLVFDEQGQQTRVTYRSETDATEACYRLVFDDGTSIVAGESHEWEAQSYLDRRHRRPPRVYTTGEMWKHRRPPEGRAVFRIKRSQALIMSEAALPVDPYTFGLWIGNGNGAKPEITINRDDVSLVKAHIPYPISHEREQAGWSNQLTIPALRAPLVAMGLYGDYRKKRLPPLYLRASIRQRWALLQGLMDSDGCVSTAGQSIYGTILPALAEDVLDLVRSLGIKATSNIVQSDRYDVPNEPYYRILFTAFDDMAVSALPRKLKHRKKHAPTTFSDHVYVSAIEPVSTVETRCIAVDSPSHLYLAGRGMVPTHNTALAAGIVLYVLFCDGEKGAQLYSAAADRDQAALVYAHAKGMVLQEPALKGRAQIYETAKSIVVEQTASFYKVISAEANTKHGYNSHLVIIDELHAQKDSDLVDVLMTSTGARRQPLIVHATTSDFERPSICNEKHNYASSVRDGVIEDTAFLPIVYEATVSDDWTDSTIWAKANPNLGVSLSREYMEHECKRAQESPRYQNTFKRLHLNIRCVTKATLVRMVDGTLKRADMLCLGDAIEAFDERTGQLVAEHILDIASMPPASIYEVETSRGRTLQTNAAHPYWCRYGRSDAPQYGWKRAETLQIGDRVGVALGHCPLPPGGRRISRHGARLLGIFAGDGCCHGSPRLTTSDPELADFYQRFVESLGDRFAPLPDGIHFDARHHTRSLKRTATRRFLQKYEMWRVIDREKTVPKAIFFGGQHVWAEFLSGYLDTDGHVSCSSIVWISKSRALLSGCQELLAFLGIQASLRDFTIPTSTMYRLEVMDAISLDLAAKYLKPRVARKKQALKMLVGRTRRTLSVAKDRRQFDRVIRITKLPEQETIGLTVNRCHTHITNGLITHNTEQDVRWLDLRDWDACASDAVSWDDLAGQLCFAGLDLASTSDLCAFEMYFPARHAVLSVFWLPEATASLRKQRARVPYPEWAEQGFIRLTEGNVTDFDVIRRDINELGETFDVQDIAIDRWNSTQLQNQLVGDGFVVTPFGQGFQSMSAPTKELERLVLAKELQHDGHPVLRWNMNNAMIEQDAAGNIKVSKRRSSEKIDGVVALIMGIGRAIAQPVKTGSIYEKRGVLML